MRATSQTSSGGSSGLLLKSMVRAVQHMCAGAVAGIAEHVAMYPVDTIKTRMQALGHPGQRVRLGVSALANMLPCLTLRGAGLRAVTLYGLWAAAARYNCSSSAQSSLEARGGAGPVRRRMGGVTGRRVRACAHRPCTVPARAHLMQPPCHAGRRMHCTLQRMRQQRRRWAAARRATTHLQSQRPACLRRSPATHA